MAVAQDDSEADRQRAVEEYTIYDVQIRLDRSLGRGSYGAVYEGTWQGTEVAVKRLHDIFSQDLPLEQRAHFLQDFAQEWRLMGRLRHPNIVQFLGVFEPNGVVPALVMEKLDMSLKDRYGIRPFLTDWQALRLGADVLSGLNHLHARGIIHRDLACKNVLLTRGHEPTAKLADLGVARCLAGGDIRQLVRQRPLTQAPGTLAYMSPESLSVRPVYDQRHDIFSFGVLLLATLIRREPPFWERDRLQRDTEVERRGADLDELGENYALREMIVRCLHDNPANRPTAAGLLQECHELLQSTTFRPAYTTDQGKAALSELNHMLDGVFADRDYARSEMTRVRQDLANAEQEHQHLLREYTALHEQERQLRETIAENMNQLGALNRQLEEERTEHAAEVSGLNDELAEERLHLFDLEGLLEVERTQHAVEVSVLNEELKEERLHLFDLEGLLKVERTQHAVEVNVLNEELKEERLHLFDLEGLLEVERTQHAVEVSSLNEELKEERLHLFDLEGELKAERAWNAAKLCSLNNDLMENRSQINHLNEELKTESVTSTDLSEEDVYQQWKAYFQELHELRDDPCYQWQRLAMLHLSPNSTSKPRRVAAAEYQGYVYIGWNGVDMWRSACDDLATWECVQLAAYHGKEVINFCKGIFSVCGRLIMIARSDVHACGLHLFELARSSTKACWLYLAAIDMPCYQNCGVTAMTSGVSSMAVIAGGQDSDGKAMDEVWTVTLKSPYVVSAFPKLPEADSRPCLNHMQGMLLVGYQNPFRIYRLDLLALQEGWQVLFAITPRYNRRIDKYFICNGHFMLFSRSLKECVWYNRESKQSELLPDASSVISFSKRLIVLPISGGRLLAIGANLNDAKSTEELAVLQLCVVQEEEGRNSLKRDSSSSGQSESFV